MGEGCERGGINILLVLVCSCMPAEEDDEEEAGPGVMGGWPYWNDSGFVISGEGVELYEGERPTDRAGEWLEEGLQV